MKIALLLHSILFSCFIFTVSALPLQKRSYSGDGTFYTVGLGSCGKTSSDTDYVAALSSSLMSKGDYCGKKIKVTTHSGSVTATVVDVCPSCSPGSVDLSLAAFKRIGKVAAGRIHIKWSFL